MPQNNQITAPLGSYIPRNAQTEANWFRLLTQPDQRPQDADGFAVGQTAYSVPNMIQKAFVDQGLLERRLAENRMFYQYRITEAGRAALRDYEASKMMSPREADNYLAYRALQRLQPEAA